MVAIVNEANIPAETFGAGAERRRLLTQTRVPQARVRVDRLSLGRESACTVSVPDGALGWFMMLRGEAQLQHGSEREKLREVHAGLLPGGLEARFSSVNGAELLYAEVPDAAELDPNLAAGPLQVRLVDREREPVLDSKHDARKRIYVATPKLTGTKALKAEVIVYPPNTTGSNHHHEGAEHFMYVIEGRTAGYSNEIPHEYVTGDLVYHPGGERHYAATGAEGMTFIEFFVPAEYRTVWVDESRICTWLPTGKDSRGGKPVREIQAHDSLAAGRATPADL